MRHKFHIYIKISAVAFWTLLKRLMILLVLFALGWFAYGLFVSNIIHGSGFGQGLTFIILWIISAYIFIPRIHRVLTKLYIPDYFIGRIKTGDGLLSDPVNLAFICSENDLHNAMKNSGWVLADKLNIQNGIKVILATFLRRSYSTAPVNNAYLFGRLQDFAYQQETNGKIDTRHHIRFWRVPKGWVMPGGYKVDWVASGTYDKAIGISYLTFQVAHKISSETDIERDYIIESLNTYAKPKKVTIIKNYSSAYHHRSSGGDMIITDGSLPIIEL